MLAKPIKILTSDKMFFRLSKCSIVSITICFVFGVVTNLLGDFGYDGFLIGVTTALTLVGFAVMVISSIVMVFCMVAIALDCRDRKRKGRDIFERK